MQHSATMLSMVPPKIRQKTEIFSSPFRGGGPSSATASPPRRRVSTAAAAWPLSLSSKPCLALLNGCPPRTTPPPRGDVPAGLSRSGENPYTPKRRGGQEQERERRTENGE